MRSKDIFSRNEDPRIIAKPISMKIYIETELHKELKWVNFCKISPHLLHCELQMISLLASLPSCFRLISI